DLCGLASQEFRTGNQNHADVVTAAGGIRGLDKLTRGGVRIAFVTLNDGVDLGRSERITQAVTAQQQGRVLAEQERSGLNEIRIIRLAQLRADVAVNFVAAR